MKNLLSLIIFLLLFSCKNEEIEVSSTILAGNITELNIAIKNAEPGTVITMKDGVWKDTQLKFHGMGTKQKPIVLKSETAGGVTLEGQSVLKLSGEYLVVKDLYFKNGYTPDDAVIIFRNSKDSIAFNCRVTGTVIEDFTQPDRHRKDHWVEFYGQHNELDNCYIAGKSNEGPTVKVYLNGNEHINNYHKIHHNHFGPRPRKGGPKAETMQLGASNTSMTPSYTQVTNNLFEKCNGEVEIISSKSNFNNFSNNVFLESEGSVVTRHGNYATIDGNIFIANGNPYVGGIRVINTGHWITNNYFLGLTGKEFRGALAVMNGIPKSPLNRYNQVTDAVIAHNSWINCEQPIHFSVGVNLDQAAVLPPSEIRSARPERVIFANNLVYNDKHTSYPIKAYDSIDGVKFKNNLMISNQTMDSDRNDFKLKSVSNKLGKELFFTPPSSENDLYTGFGFERINFDLFGKSRLNNDAYVGAIVPPISDNKIAIDPKNYGATWFTAQGENKNPKIHPATTTPELLQAIEKSVSGDHISLKTGIYEISQSIIINKVLKMYSESNENPAVINFSNDGKSFILEPKGILKMNNLELKGTGTQTLFGTLDKEMSRAYGLELKNLKINNFKNVIDVSKGSFADEISLINVNVQNCDNGLLLNKETDDKGDYNVEFLTIKNSHFEKISNQVIDFYRGGYDESTIGGVFHLENTSFKNCGRNDKDEILINTRGIVNVTFENNKFANNYTKLIAVLWGAKGQEPINNEIVGQGKIKVVENIELKLVY
jgi:poly(beta-D-mannuronate) lyase